MDFSPDEVKKRLLVGYDRCGIHPANIPRPGNLDELESTLNNTEPGEFADMLTLEAEMDATGNYSCLWQTVG